MHAGGVETWKKSKYEYRDQLEVRLSSYMVSFSDFCMIVRFEAHKEHKKSLGCVGLRVLIDPPIRLSGLRNQFSIPMLEMKLTQTT